MAIYKKGYYDLYMYKGDSGNVKIDGIPVTGDFTVYFQVFNMDGTPTNIEEIKQSFYKPFVTFGISAELSDTLEPGQYYYAVKLCLPMTDGSTTEETVIPPLRNTTVTPANYKNKAYFWVYPKQIEGNEQW